jgi:serine/threonine protein phosphatase PrpC
VAVPEIKMVTISADFVYLMLGSDGIFDYLENNEINKVI